MYQTALKSLKTALVPGNVYRRKELVRFSSNLDRYLSKLVAEGVLRKVKHGIYACPSTSVFGEVLPDEHKLLKTFLKDEHFVVFSPGVFNSLGVGTTQLYNERIVLNRKRHGKFVLGGREYFFHRRLEVPTQRQATREYFAVELLNRLDDLAEDREAVLARLKENLSNFNNEKLRYATKHYATYSTQLKFEKLFEQQSAYAN